jgi:large subunit ribosomal protein L29
MLRAEEIREMTDADLAGRIQELEEERFRLNFRSATEPLEDPLRLRSIRKDIARLKTVARERELATAAATAPAGKPAAKGGAKAARSARRGDRPMPSKPSKAPTKRAAKKAARRTGATGTTGGAR